MTELSSTALGALLAAAVVVLCAIATRLALHPAPVRAADARPTPAQLARFAGVGVLAGLATQIVALAGGIALGGAPLAAPWSLLFEPDTVAAACLAAILFCVRGESRNDPWWLLGPGAAVALPWLGATLAPEAASAAPLRLGLLAATAASLLLAPALRSRRLTLARVAAFQAAGDGVIVLDRRGRILEAQGAAAEILMASALTAKDGGQRLPGIVEMRLSDPECRRLRMKASASRFIEVWLNGGRGQTAKGGLRGLLVRDISKQYQDERKLIRLAHFDSLTGLPNRRLFLEKIQAELSDAARSGGVTALLYLDLDQFKEINDTHGHGAGDSVLKQLAARLVSSLGAGAGGEFNMFNGRRIRSFRLAAGDTIFSPGPPNDSERVAAAILGGVDGRVGATDQGLDVVAILRAERDADARRGRHAALRDRQRLGHDPQDAASQLARRLGVGDPRRDDRELVARESRDTDA